MTARPTLTLVALLLAGCAGAAAGQRAEAAPSILLRIHPHVGDTLHTRLDQQTEVVAVMPGAAGPVTKSITTSVALNSRTIVQSTLPAATTVLTVVDSADIHTSDAHGAAQVADAQRLLRGREMVLTLATDGAVESARDAHGGSVPRGMADAMSAMPAVFPRRPIAVGEQWTRELPLPAGGPLGTRGVGHVSAVFRLDSLDRSGGIAFLSMHGDVLPDPGSQGVELSGSVRGAMQVDRARGWLTDSRFTVTVNSLVTPPAPSSRGQVRFATHVTQRLHTMDKR